MQHWIKGTGVASFIGVLRERLSPEQWAQFLAGVGADGRALLQRQILAVEWIDSEHTAQLGEWVHEHVFAGDEKKLLSVIHESARRDLSGLYKLLIRVMSPESVAERAAKIFRTYVKTGEMVVSEKNMGTKGRVVLNVTDYCLHPFTWYTLRGYIEAPLLMTSAKNVSARLIKSEKTDTGAQLQYEVTWEI